MTISYLPILVFPKFDPFFIYLFILFFISYMTLSYLPILVFPKFDPLTATGMALCVNLGPK